MLELEHLRVENQAQGSYRLDDISFAIGPGEVVGLVGESGSGKSTVGQAIVKFTSIDQGCIRWQGEPLDQVQGLYKQVQYIFQNPKSSFDPRQSFGQSLRDTLRYSRGIGGQEAEAYLDQALEEVGLKRDYKDKLPGQVSGGECQRVAIARALLVEPALLICDEITSALDGQRAHQIVDLLKSLQEKRGLALLFISHDIALVSRFTERLLVLYQGRLLEDGPTKDVLANPKHAYTKRLWEAAFLEEDW